MAIVKKKFWSLLAASAAGMAAFLGFNMSRPVLARTIETRLADVQTRLELLKQDHREDISRTIASPQSNRATEADETVVSQFTNWNNWNNWSDYTPSWNNWSNTSWDNTVWSNY